MKVCPACRTTFDDSQNFCLNDGTPLTVAETEQETIVVPPQSNVEYRSYGGAPNQIPTPPPAARTSKNGLILGLTALGALLLVGLGAGAWLMSRGDADKNVNGQIARSNGNVNSSVNSVSNSATPRALPTVSQTNTSVANSAPPNPAVAETGDVDVPENQPAPPPVAPIRISEKQAATVRKEVSGAVNSWGKAISSSLDGHMNYYADTLEYYYNARGISKNQVRADKQRAFETFDNVEFKITNVRVTPDDSGERATVVYDKEWFFDGPERSSEGKVQSQMTLQKFGNRWLIVGERDLKVYYQESR